MAFLVERLDSWTVPLFTIAADVSRRRGLLARDRSSEARQLRGAISSSSTVASGSISSSGTRIEISPIGSALNMRSSTEQRLSNSSARPLASTRAARTRLIGTPRTVTVSYGRIKRCR